ncbi:MAG TPA: putative glycolipid-binding domain-containing protein [Ktedonobacteraceae bacterium]|nr:putative glycolipid-binding domain-containing protein [Ktedonobacteraceae bacterium]
MERHVMWSSWAGPGLEHLHLYQQQGNIVADSLILGVEQKIPFRVRYEIHCNQQWKLRSVHLSLLSSPPQSLHLLTDGDGTWTTENGETIPSLKGCLDVDISTTPFTNTLPIRRLALPSGSSTTLSMVYIAVPQMHMEVTEQRYTCLEAGPSGGRYLFESLTNGFSNFTAELPVDRDGLVLDYPGLFRRVGAW